MLLSLTVILFLFSSSLAHIRLVYPTPRSLESGLKQWPCGGYPFWAPNSPNSTISPGTLTIKWEETINHIGAPFRIAISVGDDENFDCIILADHIPHNDEWAGYSSNNPKPYSFNVTIPDIKCDKCTLQIINAMTDKIQQGTCCPYPNDDIDAEKCFSVYHSCANIKITGSKDSSQFTENSGPTGAYTQESATWSFDNTTWWLTGTTNWNANKCSAIGSGQYCKWEKAPDSKKKSATGAIVALVLLVALGGGVVIGIVVVKKTGKPKSLHDLLTKCTGNNTSKYTKGRDYFPDENDQEM